jgi:hypothetical protein
VAVAADPPGSGAPADGVAAPLRVYVSWLDENAAVLAFRSRGEKGRVVVGVAMPFQNSAPSERGHLYQISGFQDAVPTQTDLTNFREGLAAHRALLTPQSKYAFTLQPLDNRSGFTFDRIDQSFLEYIRTPSERPGELEVWDITLLPPVSPFQQTLTVIFVGDLVLVKSKSDLSVRGRTEAAMVDLLSRLARDENLPVNSVALRSDCGGARHLLALQANPLKYEERRSVRDSVAGAIEGSAKGDGAYSVVNTGWKKKILRLEVQPAERAGEIKAVASPGDETTDGREVLAPSSDEITGAGLELQPCRPLSVSAEPRSWYREFRRPVSFTLDGETLTAQAPQLGVHKVLLIVGSILSVLALFFFGLRSVVRARRARLTSAAKQGDGPTAAVYKGEKVEGGRRRRLFIFPRRSEPRTATGAPDAPPAAVELRDLIQGREAAYAQAHEMDSRLGDYLEKALLDAQSSSEALQEALKVREERDRWASALKPLGATPEEALSSWQRFNETRETFGAKVIEINALLNGADPTPGAKAGDNGQAAGGTPDAAVRTALAELSEAMPMLKRDVEEYRGMARRIQLALDPALRDDDSHTAHTPAHLAEAVEGMRSLLEDVLRKYAEPLRLGSGEIDLSALNVTALKERFARWSKRHASIRMLESDERVRRARAVSAEMAHVGRVLREGRRPNYDELLDGSEINLGSLAQGLLKAAESSDAALAASVSKLAGAAGDGPGGRESFDAKEIDKILVPFTRHILVETPAKSVLLHMLRLWQIMEAYCRESAEAAASDFYEQGQEFLRGCEQVIADLARLGVHLHPVRFFRKPCEDSDGAGEPRWKFTEVGSTPSIQNSPKIYAPIRDKLKSNSDEYGRTVADVNAWGFDCDLAPDLKRPTELWRW